MDESDFDKLGREELDRIADALDDVDPDDVDMSSSDGVLTLEFRDGVKAVINTHRAARQIWMAAVASAWKFSYDGADGLWRTDTGDELRATLRGLLKDRVNIDFKL